MLATRAVMLCAKVASPSQGSLPDTAQPPAATHVAVTDAPFAVSLLSPAHMAPLGDAS